MPSNFSDDLIRTMTSEQRAATVALLDNLTDDQWRRMTLCSGWTAEHLAAHLSMSFRIGMPRLALAMLRSRGNFDKAADSLARRDVNRMTRAELVDSLRENVTTDWSPPGGDLVDSLCHDVIHGLDLTEGLGVPSTATSEALHVVLQTIRDRDRIAYFGGDLAGRTLVASDVDFQVGDGPELSAPAATVVLVLTGRITVDGNLRRTP